MAYMCVFNHNRECDGCMECEKEKEEIDLRWDGDYADYKGDIEREDAYFGRE